MFAGDLLLKDSILPVYDRIAIDFVNGRGSLLFDDNGIEYLDFISGLGANIFGHNDEGLLSIFSNTKIIHLSNLYSIKSYNEYAELIVGCTPFDNVFACNSGAESVECALKIMLHYSLAAKKFIQNPEIISFSESFHGRSISSSSISEHGRNKAIYNKVFANVKFVKRDDINDFISAIGENTACVILEPILGHGGIKPFSKDFLIKVRDICYEKDIPLCFDCIQCGMGRTGYLFRFQDINVEPDLCVIGKGMAGGLPVGACLSKKKYSLPIIKLRDHGSTFGGNPFVMSVAKYILERLMDNSSDSIIKNVRTSSDIINRELQCLKAKHSNYISEIRVYGLMIGIDLIGIDALDATVKLAKNYKLLTSGLSGGVLRMLPPYVVKESEIKRAINCLDRFFSER